MVKVFFTRTFDFGNIQNYSLFSEYRKKRLETISNPEKRKQSICAELLLCYASEQAGFPVPVDIFTTSNGKPACKHFHFSITHSHDLVAVAVSDETVGIDAEKIDLSKNISVKRKIFTPEEYENMDVYDFYRKFTMKESYFKMTGEGLPLSPVSFSSFGKCSFDTNIFDEYAVSVCTPSKKEISYENIDIKNYINS